MSKNSQHKQTFYLWIKRLSVAWEQSLESENLKYLSDRGYEWLRLNAILDFSINDQRDDA